MTRLISISVLAAVVGVSACRSQKTGSMKWSAKFVDAAAAFAGTSGTVGECELKCAAGSCLRAGGGGWVCIIPCARDQDCPAGMVCNCGADRSKCTEALIGTTPHVCLAGRRLQHHPHDANSHEDEEVKMLVEKMRSEVARRADAGRDGGR